MTRVKGWVILKREFSNVSLGLIFNFKHVLVLRGVGYKFLKIKNYLVVDMGYSHWLKFLIPQSLHLIISKRFLSVVGKVFHEFSQFADLLT